jgi:predicted ABC-type ATPase
LKKELLIIAGPNGSGKTTFAKVFLKENKFEFLNADEIAKEKGTKTNISAGKEYFKRLEKLKTKNKNIILESTLSGLFLKKLVQEFKKEKYVIKIVFVTLNSPVQCIERIKQRVLSGGHHVPDDDVKRRFVRGRWNFWNIYKNHVEDWRLINNTESGFELVALGEKNKAEIINNSLYETFIKEVENGKI